MVKTDGRLAKALLEGSATRPGVGGTLGISPSSAFVTSTVPGTSDILSSIDGFRSLVISSASRATRRLSIARSKGVFSSDNDIGIGVAYDMEPDVVRAVVIEVTREGVITDRNG